MPALPDRIFKGAKPADLPVHVLTKRELIVNQRVAKALDVTIPADVLKRADKVVDLEASPHEVGTVSAAHPSRRGP